MRVMTWNILDGGLDGGDTGRLDHILEVVVAEKPDILVVNEAKQFNADGRRRLHVVEKALEMIGYLATADTGQHVAMYVRRGIEVLADIGDTRHYHHALLCVRVENSEGEEVTVLGTHLCPHGSLNRLLEAQRLANYARADEYVLLMGDLNSLDHYRDHRKALSALAPRYRVRYVVPGESDVVDTRVTRTLEEAGFVDIVHMLSGADAEYTAPTALSHHGEEFAQMRVDYVYATMKLASLAREARVIKTAATDAASDHYPIVVDFDFSL